MFIIAPCFGIKNALVNKKFWNRKVLIVDFELFLLYVCADNTVNSILTMPPEEVSEIEKYKKMYNEYEFFNINMGNMSIATIRM